MRSRRCKIYCGPFRGPWFAIYSARNYADHKQVSGDTVPPFQIPHYIWSRPVRYDWIEVGQLARLHSPATLDRSRTSVRRSANPNESTAVPGIPGQDFQELQANLAAHCQTVRKSCVANRLRTSLTPLSIPNFTVMSAPRLSEPSGYFICSTMLLSWSLTFIIRVRWFGVGDGKRYPAPCWYLHTTIRRCNFVVYHLITEGPGT